VWKVGLGVGNSDALGCDAYAFVGSGDGAIVHRIQLKLGCGSLTDVEAQNVINRFKTMQQTSLSAFGHRECPLGQLLLKAPRAGGSSCG
jgi:hypothetical protein